MKCPYCASPSSVTNSRSRASGMQTWRRRECDQCHALWTTHEIIEPRSAYHVIRVKKRSEPFSRDKLFVSIMNALSHRKTALPDSSGLTETILHRIYLLQQASLTPNTIAKLTHETLLRFDATAAAVYQATHTF